MTLYKVWCKRHKRLEFYTLGDLISGAATEAAGEGNFDGNTWSEKTPYKDRRGIPIYENDRLEVLCYPGVVCYVIKDDDGQWCCTTGESVLELSGSENWATLLCVDKFHNAIAEDRK